MIGDKFEVWLFDRNLTRWWVSAAANCQVDRSSVLP